MDLKKILQITNEKALDPFLKRLSLSTLAFTLLFITGLILSLP
jgi:1,4-dihydroxy-2-naphthoate octaprenyltransferase